MNKNELIEQIAKSAEISKAAAGRALNAALDAIVDANKKGDAVRLPGFGTFETTKREARTGRNPKTGQTMQIAATTTPRFRAGATYKAGVK